MKKNKYDNDVEKIIDDASKRKSKILDLSRKNLTTIPDSLYNLEYLESLNISGNNIRNISDNIKKLKKLQTLRISENKLTEIPESISDLSSLRILSLRENEIAIIPKSIGYLTLLKILHISFNKLIHLPKELGLLSKLEELHITHNQLKNIPPELGQLRQLKILDLSYNQLMLLPETLGQLSQLRTLILSSNQLTALPIALSELKNIKRLFLHDNEALGIPPEILGPKMFDKASSLGGKKYSAPQVILSWHFQARGGPTQRLNEAKMLLVGQGGVGKTSLVRYLVHKKPCNSGESPTEGINIDDWNIQGKKGNTGEFERINIHIWDFGGQEIMHATHQFFLTQRSLYLLVLDARAGEKESNIHYWLKIIQSYGGESPVLVVVNKCDQLPHELNETRLKRDYPNICGFIQTSCATGQGIVELRREISKQIRQLPHVFDELPQNYFSVKTELEQVATDAHFLPIAQYYDICQRHDVHETENQNLLIRFLHDLGVVLNFQDPNDPYGQNDPFVLNPEWVTGGVYAIVNDKDLKGKKDGLLTREKLRTILSNQNGYPIRHHDFIVRKMMQFELAYQIENGREIRWLIPELLDPKEPERLDWKPEESLNFQYSYPVLPSGVICRFIVRVHQHVDRARSWRSGTVLMIDETTILVRGDMENNKVFIAVQGSVNQRKEKLAIVRDAFRYVHSTIPALAPKEEIPLPDNPTVSVPYDHLLKLDEIGEHFFVPVGAGKRYSVTELLNGIDSDGYRQTRRRRLKNEAIQMGTKHVFISYCRDNRDEVKRLVEDLEKAGELVWWDEDIIGGQDWKSAIREAMKNAYAVVICLSPELNTRFRSGVFPEIRDAIATFRQYGPRQSFIFPIRLAECSVPPIEIDDTRTLERIQYIDLFPKTDRIAGLQNLLKSLASAPKHP